MLVDQKVEWRKLDVTRVEKLERDEERKESLSLDFPVIANGSADPRKTTKTWWWVSCYVAPLSQSVSQEEVVGNCVKCQEIMGIFN